MSEEIPFDPLPFISDPHTQAIINTFFTFFSEPDSSQKVILLPDGDRISLEITTPKGWKSTNRTVVLVHGLCGSHRSPNLVRMAHRLEPKGIRVVRFNMRGCGSGKGLSKHIYHCGRSEDLFEAVKALKKETPDSPITVVGFSLGGNIVLKMAGELHTNAQHFIDGVIAISPPVDLRASVERLSDPTNAMYERYFVRLLKADVRYRHRKFGDLPRVTLPRSLTIAQFDEIYTAPICGFRNALDYYSKCSSEAVVSDIAVPCKILLAMDDPIISPHTLDQYEIPGNVTIYKTKHGGHMGYIASPMSDRGFHWLDDLLTEWIERLN